MRQLFLGVDGGGTNCRMRLADADLNTLGEAETHMPSNLQVRDGDAAYEAVTKLIPEVYKHAGLDVNDTARTSACFGMAGGRLETARTAFESRSFGFAHLKVYDDIDIARAGAHEGEDGAVLIIGTGSAGLALVEGERHQVGGWGFHVGDTMSGAILGREALRYSLRAHEGLAPASELTKAIMDTFDGSADKLMAWSFEHPDIGRPARPTDYGRFARFVIDYYEKGDPIAHELMHFEMAAIDEYVRWFQARGAKAIAIVGGLGERLMSRITDRFGKVIVECKTSPLNGAVILARQHFAE